MTFSFARVIALFTVLFSFNAQAVPLLLSPWRPGAIQFNNETSYFSSSANYIERGEFVDLPAGNLFSVIESEFSGRYHLSRSLSAYAGASLAAVSSETATLNRDNTELTRLFFGGDFAFLKKPLFLVMEVEGSLSMSKVEFGTQKSFGSDGAHFLSSRLIASRKFSVIDVFATVGFKYRTEGLSSLLTYNLGLQKRLGDFTLGGGLAGFETLMGDSKTELERGVVVARVNAGSLKYYSFDPAIMEVRGWASWMINRAFTFNVGFSQTINGAQAAAGTAGLVGLTISLPPGKSAKNPGKKSIMNEFEIETQEVDPDLFKEDE